MMESSKVFEREEVQTNFERSKTEQTFAMVERQVIFEHEEATLYFEETLRNGG